jgi:hypothetical protein
MTDVIINHIYIDGPTNLDAFPYPDVLQEPLDARHVPRLCRPIVTLAEPDYEHFLTIGYENRGQEPICLTAIVECYTSSGFKVLKVKSQYWVQPKTTGALRVELGENVTRVRKLTFEVEHPEKPEGIDTARLCQMLEQLVKDDGMNTNFILIAHREGATSYTVRSPMGPLKALDILNQAERDIILDTARLIGEG